MEGCRPTFHQEAGLGGCTENKDPARREEKAGTQCFPAQLADGFAGNWGGPRAKCHGAWVRVTCLWLLGQQPFYSRFLGPDHPV